MSKRSFLVFGMLAAGLIACGPAAAQGFSAEDLEGRWRSSWSNDLGVTIEISGDRLTMAQRFRSEGRICLEHLHGRLRGQGAEVRSTGIGCDGKPPTGPHIACTVRLETRDLYSIRCGETGHWNAFRRIGG